MALSWALPAMAQSVPAMDPQLQRLAQSTWGEYLEFLTLPNDANVASDIQANAQWLSKAFLKRGFDVQILPNQGKPMVFAQYPNTDPDTPTVLFYMHLDGQPVVPAQWAQPSPWQPVVKAQQTDGRWGIVPTQRLFADPLDPDLRVFARSASDDKAPIMMMLAAFDGLRQSALPARVRVKVLIDSQEEQGSPSIPAVVNAHKDLLRADAIVILDGPKHASDKPTLIFGNRGALRVTLTVFGPKAPLHSGHYGNHVPNPAMRLARLLATMKDDQGRVTIDGYYDGVTLSEEDIKVLAETGDDEVQIRRRVGIAQSEQVAPTLQQSLQFPSLNIRGLASAAVGDKATNIIPDQAVAEFDLRTTPEAPPDRLFELMRRHIIQMGYHLVNAPPSDEERMQHDKMAWLEKGKGGKAVRTAMDSPVGLWTQSALKSQAESKGMVRVRMMGASVPTDALVDALGVPFVIMPLVNGDNNQHTYDENMRIGHYVQGVGTLMRLLNTPMPAR